MKKNGQAGFNRARCRRELEACLNLVNGQRKQQQEPPDVSLLFGQENLLGWMLNLLKTAELPENLYGLPYLRRAYEEFMEGKTQKFECKDLFSEGWLIASVGEWAFNAPTRSAYAKRTCFSSQREEQVICFLKELGKLPYRDEWRIRATIDGKIPEGLTGTDERGPFLDINGTCWKQWGRYVMGQWWDEIDRTEDPAEADRQESRWFFCLRLLNLYDCPDKGMRHPESLFAACLKRLEREACPAEQGHVILQRRVYLETDGSRPMAEVLTDLPEDTFDRIRYVRERGDMFWYLPSPYQGAEELFRICSGLYRKVSADLRKRFLDCLSLPYLSRLMASCHEEELMMDCLEQPSLNLITADAIWQRMKEAGRSEEQLFDSLNESATRNMLEILGNHLDGGMDREEWQTVLCRLLSYAASEWPLHFKRFSTEQKRGIMVHRQLLDWCRRVVLPQPEIQEALLAGLEREFRKTIGLPEMGTSIGTRDGLQATRLFLEYVSVFEMDEQVDPARLLPVLRLFMDHVLAGGSLISLIGWQFWQRQVWKRMMTAVMDSPSLLEEFLQIFSFCQYAGLVQNRRNRSPILEVGKAGLIVLYLMADALLERCGQVDSDRQKEMQHAFVDGLLMIQQPGCDPFEPESIRLLESEAAVDRCMEALPVLDERLRDKVLDALMEAPPGKLLFLLRGMHHEAVRTRLMENLLCRLEDDFTAEISLLPTFQSLLSNMLLLCFQDSNPALIKKAEEVFAGFCRAISRKEKRVQDMYASWTESVRLQLLLLSGREEEVLNDTEEPAARFYQGLYYLNQDDAESLKKAEQIYGEMAEETEETASKRDAEEAVLVNRLAACVRLSTHKDTGERAKRQYVRTAEQLLEEIETAFDLTWEGKRILYSNMLFLYEHLKDHEKFWALYGRLPEPMQDSEECTVPSVRMYAAEGEWDAAEKHLSRLMVRYGETERLIQLKQEIFRAKAGKTGEQIHTWQGVLGAEFGLSQMVHAYNKMKTLSERDCALLKFQKDDLEYPEELNLLEMVADAALKLEQYSGSWMYDGKTAEEDEYSKWIQILFNQRQKEIWDFYLMDQTQEGTATGMRKNGRTGRGSMDLAIYHGSRMVGFVESIKLSRLNRSEMEKHVRKMMGYNFARVKTGFLLVYSDSKHPAELWKRYRESMKEILERTGGNDWHMTGETSSKELGLLHQGKIPEMSYLYRTSHECRSNEQRMQIYHLMIDVRHEAAIQEAKAARKCGKSGRGRGKKTEAGG